ncbi:MAG: DUF3995 domain-containing protein [Salaquimonas sp.]
MIEILAIILSIILFLIAALHFYWAMGGYWPGQDEDTLARSVVGSSNKKTDGNYTMPPRALTFMVALAILVAAAFPALWAGFIIPYPIHPVMVMWGMWALAAIFLLRGIVGMLPFFAKMSPAEPFRSWNFKYYSPVCISIGTAFAVLIYLATF